MKHCIICDSEKKEDFNCRCYSEVVEYCLGAIDSFIGEHYTSVPVIVSNGKVYLISDEKKFYELTGISIDLLKSHLEVRKISPILNLFIVDFHFFTTITEENILAE